MIIISDSSFKKFKHFTRYCRSEERNWAKPLYIVKHRHYCKFSLYTRFSQVTVLVNIDVALNFIVFRGDEVENLVFPPEKIVGFGYVIYNSVRRMIIVSTLVVYIDSECCIVSISNPVVDKSSQTTSYEINYKFYFFIQIYLQTLIGF